MVLVGHSWGGTVITEAGNDLKVRALVYVAAFAPDAGESTGDQVGQHPPPPGLGGVVPFGDGFLKMGEASWIANVAQDLPEEEARTLAVVQTPLALTTFNDRIGHPAWRDRPNWYVVSSQDRAVSVDLQRALATRLQAHTTELPASPHVAAVHAGRSGRGHRAGGGRRFQSGRLGVLAEITGLPEQADGMGERARRAQPFWMNSSRSALT